MERRLRTSSSTRGSTAIVSMLLAPQMPNPVTLPLPFGPPPELVGADGNLEHLLVAELNSAGDVRLQPYPGDPDLVSSGGSGGLCSVSESGVYSPPGGTVTAGSWIAGPTECGPYTSGGDTWHGEHQHDRRDQGVRPEHAIEQR